jgi:hypothetical protein
MGRGHEKVRCRFLRPPDVGRRKGSQPAGHLTSYDSPVTRSATRAVRTHFFYGGVFGYVWMCVDPNDKGGRA